MEENYKFVYTEKEAVQHDISKLIGKARSLARAPVSTCEVGAYGQAESGRVYLGVNVEFEGLPLHHSIHAEQFLVANLALNFEKKLSVLAVSASATEFCAPCFHCRQFYLEMRNAPQICLVRKKPDRGPDKFMDLETLMPDSIDPQSKGAGFPLLLEDQNNKLVLSNSAVNICLFPEICPHPECSALEAANYSYAPYSGCPSGVALVCEDKVYKGWYIESIAHNPSLGPVQAALVDFMARGKGKKFEEIEKVVLVEMKDAKVSQEATARILVKKIAPNCEFNVVHCDKKPEEI